MSVATSAAPRVGESSRTALDRQQLPPLDQVSECLARALESSVCDETEFVWMARRRRAVAVGDQHPLELRASDVKPQTSVQVRVREAGRQGTYRIDCCRPAAVEDAMRMASAQARLSEQPTSARLPCAEQPAPSRCSLWDRSLAQLEEGDARRLLSERLRPGEAAQLEWYEAELLVMNSNGVHRAEQLTAQLLQVRSGPGRAGAGFASDASRRLEDHRIEEIFRLARSRRADDPEVERCTAPLGGPLLLAPEATAQLVELLNHRAFAADSYRMGESFLRQHTGIQVFDQRVFLRDDGTDDLGLPLPFDLEGRTKFPVSLIERGVPRTPTVDTLSASELGVEPTASCVGCQHAHAMHLFLEKGDSSEAELLELAEGGLWISRLEDIECFDPSRMLMRAHARGVRRVSAGKLAHPVPELIWEDSLLRVFSDIAAIGDQVARRPSKDGFLGGTTAPVVVIGSADDLAPASIPS